MTKKEYFFSIEIPEKEELLDYLFIEFIKSLKTEEKRYLLKIFDEIENYKINTGKFYKNKVALNERDELTEDSIFVKDTLTGLYIEVIIIKKLTHSAEVDNVYEIRMASSVYQYRIFIFPYEKVESVEMSPFVALTYGFDKQLQTYRKGNQTTDLLRDSSQRIREQFYTGFGELSNYIPDIV